MNGSINLFKRDGLYYVRLQHSSSGEFLEIALHGVLSEEQAGAAMEAFTLSSSEGVECK